MMSLKHTHTQAALETITFEYVEQLECCATASCFEDRNEM